MRASCRNPFRCVLSAGALVRMDRKVRLPGLLALVVRVVIHGMDYAVIAHRCPLDFRGLSHSETGVTAMRFFTHGDLPCCSFSFLMRSSASRSRCCRSTACLPSGVVAGGPESSSQ